MREMEGGTCNDCPYRAECNGTKEWWCRNANYVKNIQLDACVPKYEAY
jgi:hypothetical protein